MFITQLWDDLQTVAGIVVLISQVHHSVISMSVNGNLLHYLAVSQLCAYVKWHPFVTRYINRASKWSVVIGPHLLQTKFVIIEVTTCVENWEMSGYFTEKWPLFSFNIQLCKFARRRQWWGLRKVNPPLKTHFRLSPFLVSCSTNNEVFHYG